MYMYVCVYVCVCVCLRRKNDTMTITVLWRNKTVFQYSSPGEHTNKRLVPGDMEKRLLFVHLHQEKLW